MEPSAGTTRERLREAASQLFAQRGFRGASARAISAQAGTNAAAISYHFRGKRGLYEAVLTHASLGRPGCIGAAESVDGPADPASRRLHAFIHGWLSRLLGNGFDAWQAQVAARELAEPVGGLTREAQDAALRPLVQLETLVRGILPHASDEAVRYFMLSIAGQCLFYFNCRAIIHRLNPSLGMAQEEVRLTADHVSRFSLSGMTMAASHEKG